MNSRSFSPVLLLLFLGLAGCHHVGPSTIVADRVPYNDAVATSWKDQTLLNIVKLRYVDTPFFVDVPSVVSGYTVTAGVNANGLIAPPVNPMASFAQQLGGTLGYQGAYLDRPTISYVPQTGAQFLRNLTNPIPPSAILYLIQSGYAADFILSIGVDSINGIKNRISSGGVVQAGDPEFQRVRDVWRRAQLSGNINLRIDVDKEKKESTVLVFRDTNIDPELAKDLVEVRKLIGIDPEQHEYRVVFGALPTRKNEIALMTRSVFRILIDLSNYVDVPSCHLAEGRAPDLGDLRTQQEPPFHVFSSCKKPCDCFASVCYRGYWFWVDDRDTRSKRVFSLLMGVLAVADTGAKEAPPLVTTIQAN
jgi:hypothetical protein